MTPTVTTDRAPPVADGLPPGQPVAVKRRPGFQPGRQKTGGRKPGTGLGIRMRTAAEVAAEMGFHPVEFFAIIAREGIIPNPDGSVIQATVEQRLDAAKAILPYVIPKLAQTTITGKDEGPIKVASLDVTQLLANPAALEAANELAIRLAEAQQLEAINARRD